jgi:hypothetical protein
MGGLLRVQAAKQFAALGQALRCDSWRKAEDREEAILFQRVAKLRGLVSLS